MAREFKRIAAVHDICGLGRSSLAAVMPILSVMGIQVCPLPTAVLSTQTSGFEGYTFVDLTENIGETVTHWKAVGVDFDCIYTGFLGSQQQVHCIERMLDVLKTPQTLVVVDPVMGDDGILYDTMDATMVAKMGQLICRADMITPNYTELLYLLGWEYQEQYEVDQIQAGMKQLAEKGPRYIVATSIPMGQGQVGVIAYDKAASEFAIIEYEHLPVSYPGTGDIFTSVVVGYMVKGHALFYAVEQAVDFLGYIIKDAIAIAEPIRDGVFLEENLYRLVVKKR